MQYRIVIDTAAPGRAARPVAVHDGVPEHELDDLLSDEIAKLAPSSDMHLKITALAGGER